MKFEDLKLWYANLWDRSEILDHRRDEIVRICMVILSNRKTYEDIERKTYVPWYLVAALHNLEAGLNFNACLHNGDPWNKPTVHVPKGRGPFSSFVDAAVDALILDGLHNERHWTVEKCLFRAEGFNGWGYMRYHSAVTNSPYLWSGTNQCSGRGKYISDGHFDETARNDAQIGVAAVLKWLVKNAEIEIPRETGLGLEPKLVPVCAELGLLQPKSQKVIPTEGVKGFKPLRWVFGAFKRIIAFLRK